MKSQEKETELNKSTYLLAQLKRETTQSKHINNFFVLITSNQNDVKK